MSKKIICGLIAALSFSSVWAETVDFPAGQTNGSFNCTASDPAATVSIDTHTLKANGFCAGNPYVTSPGHISGMPVSELSNYFEITKEITASGSVTVSVTKGSVTCGTGHGEKTSAYGNGDYCYAP